MQVRFLGWEDPLEECIATHSSILAWRTPWTEEPGGAMVHGVAQSRTQLKQLSMNTHSEEDSTDSLGQQGDQIRLDPKRNQP